MSKIGVLTFHRCINYGSYWQSRCLVEAIQFRGHEAVLLDHDSGRINLAEWKCALQPVLPTHVPAGDRPLYREKIKKFFTCFDKLPMSRRFNLDDPGKMEIFDTVVVGSDEVWNLFHPWYGKCSLFYGDGIRAERIISYASSFGNYSASWGLESAWADRLRNFSAISVRDENSRMIVQHATGVGPELVLDPCLQFEVNPDAEAYREREPYIAVYGHNFSAEFAAKIRQAASERKLPLVSIGYRNDWADEQWITADPHEFAHFMANAAAVATNFFHGCVFAVRNGRPFVSEITPYRSNKLQGLMATLGGEHHLLTSESAQVDFNHLLLEPLRKSIFSRLAELRQFSNDFLDRALEIQQQLIA